MKFISAGEIRELFNFDQMVRALQQGFVQYDQLHDRQGGRFVFDMGNGNSATVIGPGTLPSIPAYTIKVNSKFPTQQPALKGVVSLFDLDTGTLMAQMDSSEITSIRTGLSAAMASHYLSEETETVTIIGAGQQNRKQLEFLLKFRTIKQAIVYDVSPEQSNNFCTHFKDQLEIVPIKGLREACHNATMLLAATWSKEPILHLEDIGPMTHITTLGADEPKKVEVSKRLVLGSKLFVDDTRLNMEMGTPGNLGLSTSCVDGTIGSIYASPELATALKGERTIYSPVGLAFQDLVVSWSIFKNYTGNVTY